MADITNELIYEVLKNLQHEMSLVKASNREIKAELQAERGRFVGLQHELVALHQDVQNIYSVLERQDGRLERIERRLELTDKVQ